MGYVLNLVASEEKKIRVLKEEYEKQLLTLPKGSIRTRKRGERIYYYLSYRDGGKVVTDYVGKEEEKISELRELLEKRKHIEGILRRINYELDVAQKVLEEEK